MLPQLRVGGATARESVFDGVSGELVAKILSYLPLRERLECATVRKADVVWADVANAQLLLSHARCFDALRLQQLTIGPEEGAQTLALSESDVATLVTIMEAHPSAWALHVVRASFDVRALDALAASAAARRLTRLSLRACRLPDDTCAGAALALLLTEGGEFELDMSGCGLGDAALQLLREAAAAAPRATLRCGN